MSQSGGVYLYVSEDKAKRIRVLRLGSDGTLEPVQNYDLGGEVQPMTVSPDRRTLYAVVRSEPRTVVSLAINRADGTLSTQHRTPLPESSPYLSTDKTGRHLLVAFNIVEPRTRRSGLIGSYPIGPTGAPLLPVTLIRTPPKMHAVLTDASNRFALGPSCNGDMIMRYRFDERTGELDPDGLAPILVRPGSGPRHMRFHPNNRYLYLMNEYDASVVAFRWKPETGMLYELETYSAAPDMEPGEDWEGGWRGADVQISPDGRNLYASVRNSNTVAHFRVDPLTGLLSLVAHHDAAREPRSLCVDPSGRFLIATGMQSACLVVYAIDPADGTLSRKDVVPTGKGPNWIECVPLP
ncbi:lactonase family protein [Salipiger sp.]|uniref:lactonase family protein n=1 Tax=Salipiger sp. TaxID=2078585 RepID=UPI003A96BCA8